MIVNAREFHYGLISSFFWELIKHELTFSALHNSFIHEMHFQM